MYFTSSTQYMTVFTNGRKIHSVKHKHLAQRHDYVAITHFAIPAV